MEGPEKNQEKSGTRASREVRVAALESLIGGLSGMAHEHRAATVC